MTELDDKDKRLAVAIGEYLDQLVSSGAITGDDVESLGVAKSCILEAFRVMEETEAAKYSIKPASLKSIFDVYLNMQKSQQGAQKQTAESSAAGSSSSSSAQTQKEAEEVKKRGNQLLVEKKYAEAIEQYGKAIELDASNPVYYSNRAAAYSQLGQHENAIKDCECAIAIDEKFVKAYSRLGLAYYSLGKYEDAVKAYEKSLELDPSNEVTKNSLSTARQKARSGTSSTRSAPGANPLGGAAGGLPNLGGMDLNALMSNPAIMNMAQQVMSNPQMASMLGNMMGGAGGQGGAGGMPNLQDLMAAMGGAGAGGSSSAGQINEEQDNNGQQ
ncbi:hypothetical protein MIR68_012175 [Amoeboaphelidium protococcarum]|nr:hypothetical protein MIR68_012175 [Amoeboaphelidium protococcarum]